ncbi:uncharacterized protein LOC143533271 [Bidens hawaiensis]|uniref:uncharacterized protein LOC143533271 n=1 Tax=Bidens hawaiensis TaxID=980011 RepID=UPI00404B3602
MNNTAATTILPEKMGGVDLVPVEVGACGTVASLVLKEIEYFRRLESGGDDGKCSVKNSINPNKRHGDGGSSFWTRFGFLTIIWQRGESKGSSGGARSRYLPRMCTMVHVAVSRLRNHHKLTKIPSFSYQNLKDDNTKSVV